MTIRNIVLSNTQNFLKISKVDNKNSNERSELSNIVTKTMSKTERKEWIYNHVDDTIIGLIIYSMNDSEVENELNKIE